MRGVDLLTSEPVHLATRISPPPTPSSLPPPMYRTDPSALTTLVGVPVKSERPTVASGREPSPASRTITRVRSRENLPVSKAL